MFVDLTQKIIEGYTYREGSPPLKIDNQLCFETIDGKTVEYTTSVLSVAAHNMGTHIDTIAPIDIPLSKLVSKGVKIDVSDINKKVIEINDINLNHIEENCFVIFHTGWDKYLYSDKYYEHPEIDINVIKTLIDKKVNMIGIDALGIGKGKNHGKIDRILADNGIYAVENLTNLSILPDNNFTVYCFPLKIKGLEAHPARVIAKI